MKVFIRREERGGEGRREEFLCPLEYRDACGTYPDKSHLPRTQAPPPFFYMGRSLGMAKGEQDESREMDAEHIQTNLTCY